MAKKPTGTDVMDWEKEMEQQAALAAGAQRSSGGGGKFFSAKAGVLSFDGNPLPGNQMAVIILADIIENSWYDGPYDPETRASPKCFAFAHDEDDLTPHEAVDKDPYFDRQAPSCFECPRNEWGSAETGRGKDCKNVMRIAVIPAGEYVPQGKGRNVTYDLKLIEEAEHFARAEVAFLKIPVMSVKHYAKYVKQLNADMRRPPHGVITNIFIEPDPKSQFKFGFELIDTVDGEYMPTIMKRHAAEKGSIGFPYSPPQNDDAPTEGARGASANKLRGKGAAKPKPKAGRR